MVSLEFFMNIILAARKQLNIFERKVYRRILGPVYDNEKENWRILTNEEIYANIKKPTITERGTAVAQWLRCCATNRKVAGSIPAGVLGFFQCHKILPIALWPWGRLSL